MVFLRVLITKFFIITILWGQKEKPKSSLTLCIKWFGVWLFAFFPRWITTCGYGSLVDFSDLSCSVLFWNFFETSSAKHCAWMTWQLIQSCLIINFFNEEMWDRSISHRLAVLRNYIFLEKVPLIQKESSGGVLYKGVFKNFTEFKGK